MATLRRPRIFGLLFLLLLLCLFVLNADLRAEAMPGEKGGHQRRMLLNITITPDKNEYEVNQTATFAIEIKRNNKPERLRLEQIEATFPDENTPITLVPLSRGNYTYTTSAFTAPGEYTLSITIRTWGAVRSKKRSRHKRVKDEAAIIGQTSYTISVVTSAPDTPQLNDPAEADEDGQYTISWSDESAGGAVLYELQEDNADTFTIPTTYWLTANLQEILQTEEGTYYYRVRAWSAPPQEEGLSSDWSNTVDITVDFPFASPPEDSTAGYIHGFVYDSSTDTPLAASEITVKDVEGTVLSNAEGKFAFPVINYPQGNKKQIILTIEKPGYTYAQRWVTVTATRDTSVDHAYLTPLDTNITTITPAGGTAKDSTGKIELTFPPAAIDADIEVTATWYDHSRQLPATLPEASFFTYALDLKPDDVVFNEPVKVKFANTRGFAPGTPIPVGYWNKATAIWEHETMAKVIDDEWVEFEVTHFSPRDINLPVVPPPQADKPRGKDRRSVTKLVKKKIDQKKELKDPGVGVRSGVFTAEHMLPSVKFLGKSEGLIFNYTSSSADPSAYIATETDLDTAATLIPRTSGSTIETEGVRGEVKFEGAEGGSRQASLFKGENARGTKLPTGSYPYTIKLSNDYKAEYATADYFGGPPTGTTGVEADELKSLTTVVTDRFIINNQIDSPFGAGWTLNGLQRLHFDPDGTLLLTEGDGSAGIFTPQLGEVSYLDQEQDVSSLWALLPSDPLSTLAFPLAQTFTPQITGYLKEIEFELEGSGGFDLPEYPEYDVDVELYITAEIRATSNGVPAEEVIAISEKLIWIPYTDIIINEEYGQADWILYRDWYRISFPASPVLLTAGVQYAIVLSTEVEINVWNPDNSWLYSWSEIGWLHSAATDPYPPGKSYYEDTFTTGQWTVYNEDYDFTFRTYMLSLPLIEGDAFASPAGDFSTLVRNEDSTYTRILKDGTKINFDSSGLHTSTVDRNGNTTTYTYADINNDEKPEELVQITLPTGGNYSLTYDERGKLETVTDPAGRISRFWIDANGNLKEVVTPDGAATQYAYDENHLIDTITDPAGRITAYKRGEEGRYNQLIFESGETINFVPSETRGLIDNIPEGSGIPENPAEVVPADIKDILTNGRGIATSYLTDKFGAVLKKEDAFGRVSLIERDEDSNPVRITQPNGAVTTFTYDNKGNPLTITQQPIDATTRFIYNAFGQITSITDPQGNKTQIDYDQKGNPVIITDASGSETAMSYDQRGLLISITDTLTNQTTFTYDEKGNLTETTDPLGNTNTLNYDTAGNVITSTDAAGRITRFEYDEMNRLIFLADPDNQTTYYQYDPNGNLIKITDANNNQTTFEYNQVNQLIKIINPLGQEKTFTYDLNRNLISATDAKGQTMTLTYDAIDQLIKKTLPGNLITTYAYDAVNNLISVINPDSALAFDYDLASRLTSTSTAGSAVQPEVAISYTYDKNGNRISMADPTGTTQYIYDALNRLTSLTNSQSQTTTFDYDELSRRTSINLSNGITTNYTYDPASQLTGLQSPVTGYQYEYDNTGNRTEITEPAGTNTYTYDDLNRLTQATHPQLSNQQEFFNYDPAGNRTNSHLSTNYTYDSANRLLEDNQFTYTYDNNGNLISKTDKSTLQTTAYTYNAENQLIFVDRGPWTVDYKYDGLGRRIQKDINGQITRYVYDNEDILLEYNGSNTLTATYTHGPGIDEPLIMERAGQSYYYHTDGLGSITSITNSIGTIVQTYLYDSFGNIVTQTGTLTNPYAYTGREYDPESGLYYYRARYYEPLVGRFLGEDPLGFAGGINFYEYVFSNPINNVDPLGLLGEKEIRKKLDKRFGDKLSEKEKEIVSRFTGKQIGFRHLKGLLKQDPKALKELENRVRKVLEKADEEIKNAFKKLEKLEKAGTLNPKETK